MATQCYLGVDLGAESGRVMAGLFDGSTIRVEQVNRFPTGGMIFGDTMRWDVLRIWTEILNGLAAGGAQYRDEVRSVGVDTWGVDYALFTDRMEMLGNPYHYRDIRTQGLLDEVLQRVSRQEIFSATGLQFMELNTLYQLVAHHRQHPGICKLAKRFLMMPDLFHWLMSGSEVVEFTNATTTQFFNAQTGTWAYDLLKKLDLSTEMFGEVVSPGTNLGKLRPHIVKQHGVPNIDVVAPATHDTGSAVVGVPTQLTGTSGWAYISSGTWSLMGVEVRSAVLTPRALELNVTNEGGVDGTYRLLKNIMGLWLVQECRRSFERKGKSLDYATLVQMAEASTPFRSLVNPDDHDFLAPPDMATAFANWCSSRAQPAPSTEGEFIRCALESLALKYRIVLEYLEELTGTKIEVIHVVGGGCQNQLLNQFTANACGRPVIAGPAEATVLGNLMVQARSAGEVGSLQEIRDVIRRSSELLTYTPQDTPAWEAALQRFRGLIS
ncbi:MAG: rhamnulokinase [Planctomycetaceae bacterium]|nr:rhamnulokinase [Planctomycetaceae bacterium]